MRFFPGARPLLATIDDAIAEELLGPPQAGRALTFEDQYISSGGQLYELVMGHDRWTVDLRPLVDAALRARGQALGICSHPYNLCTELVAREAGVIVTDPPDGGSATPLDVHGDVAWVGYANATLRDRIQPVLHAQLRGPASGRLTFLTGAATLVDERVAVVVLGVAADLAGADVHVRVVVVAVVTPAGAVAVAVGPFPRSQATNVRR